MDWGFQIGSVYFSSVDIIVFVLCMLGGIGGALTGFARSFTSGAGYIAGFFAALMFTDKLSMKIQETFASLTPFWSVFITFIILFIAGFIVLRLLGSFLAGIMERNGVAVINGLMGFFWGVLEAALVLSLVIYILSLQNLFDLSPWFAESVIVTRLIAPIAPQSVQFISGLA